MQPILPEDIPNDSFRSQWARHVVRERLAPELEILHKSHPNLFVPQDGQSFTPDKLPKDPAYDKHGNLPQGGTDDASTPRKVCIIGAGVAGLYIAKMLDDLDIPNLSYDILESSDRIGGRIFTYNFSDVPHDYYDIGAMRYPDIPIMKRTFHLFQKEEMPLRKYYLTGEKCPKFFNGYNFVADVEDPYNVSKKNLGSVPDDVVANADQILNDTFLPYKLALKDNPKEGWKKLMEVDDLSTREYLKKKYDFFSIQWLETMNTSTNLFDQAFSESVMDSFDFDFPRDDVKIPEKAWEDVDWYCIEGGTEQLTKAMTAKLRRSHKSKREST